MDVDRCRNFCERWLAAWTGNRPQQLVSFFCDDALYRDPAHKDGLRGREEISAYFELLLCRNPDWRFSLVDYWCTQEEVLIIKWRARIPVGEKTVDEVGVQLLQLENDLVWRCEIYFDRSDWTEALVAAQNV